MSTISPISQSVIAFQIKPYDLKKRFTQEKNTSFLSMPATPYFNVVSEEIKYLHQLEEYPKSNNSIYSKPINNLNTGLLVNMSV
ncbi:MAG: hypothetical protein AB7V50_05880 [Vampirovibrionia bacterium]